MSEFTNAPEGFRRRMRAARGGPSLTLAQSAVHLLRVLRDGGSARSRQLPLPQRLRVFGALAHFLVVQLHLADVQLVSACCDTIKGVTGREKQKQQQRNKHIPTLDGQNSHVAPGGKGIKQTKTHTGDQLKECCALAFYFVE